MTTPLDLIYAIAAGDAQEIAQNFESIVAEKITAAIDAKRLEVAKTMFTVEEEVEQIDELSRKTLKSYARKAAKQQTSGKTPEHKDEKRLNGRMRAADKLDD